MRVGQSEIPLSIVSLVTLYIWLHRTLDFRALLTDVVFIQIRHQDAIMDGWYITGPVTKYFKFQRTGTQLSVHVETREDTLSE